MTTSQPGQNNDTNMSDFELAMSQVSDELNPTVLQQSLISSVKIGATYSHSRHHGTDPFLIAKKWGIGVQRAKDTLKCTTQLNIRSAVLPLTRRYRTDLLSQQLKRLRTRFYTDTAYAKFTSLQGHTCAQIFTDGEGFVTAIPLRSKEDAGEALAMTCRDVGVPNELHYDNANKMCGPGTKFQKLCRHNRVGEDQHIYRSKLPIPAPL